MISKFSVGAALALFVASLSACVKPDSQLPSASTAEVEAEQQAQLELAALRQITQRKRLYQIASRLNLANVDLCGERSAPILGYLPIVPGAAEKRPVADAALSAIGKGGSSDRDSAYLLAVAPGSPAERIGLRAGEKILKVNDVSLNPPVNIETMENIKIRKGANSITVVRDGVPRSLTIQSVRSCDFPVSIVDQGGVNAFADGDGIYVTRGMMNFIESDEELAIVYAHELAHNVEGHVDAKRTNAIAGVAGGLVVDILFAAAGVNTNGAFTRAGGKIGAVAYSADFEKEADYVGLFYLANAGFDTSNAAQFWRRMAVENNSRAIEVAGTHPTTAERFLLLDRTHGEINAKRSAGQPLLPNQSQ